MPAADSATVRWCRIDFRFCYPGNLKGVRDLSRDMFLTMRASIHSCSPQDGASRKRFRVRATRGPNFISCKVSPMSTGSVVQRIPPSGAGVFVHFTSSHLVG